MYQEHLNMLKLAGEEAARRGLQLEDLDPYTKEAEDKKIVHVAQWQKAKAVMLLLELIKATSGNDAANFTEEYFQFRTESDDRSIYIMSLDESKWLLYAHLAALQMINMGKPAPKAAPPVRGDVVTINSTGDLYRVLRIVPDGVEVFPNAGGQSMTIPAGDVKIYRRANP